MTHYSGNNDNGFAYNTTCIPAVSTPLGASCTPATYNIFRFSNGGSGYCDYSSIITNPNYYGNRAHLDCCDNNANLQASHNFNAYTDAAATLITGP